MQALIDEPSLVRPELQPGRGLIQGAVRRADGQPAAHLPLTLTGMNRQQLAASDAAGAFRFERLSAGVYDLSSGEQLLHAGIALESDDAVQTVEVTVTEGRQSSIEADQRHGRPAPGQR